MTKRKHAAALDAGLRGMFRALEDRGVPEHVMRTVDQLDEAAARDIAAESGEASARVGRSGTRSLRGVGRKVGHSTGRP